MVSAGLYLPTSDMDLVVVHSGCTDIPRALRGIGNTLVAKGMAKGIQVSPLAFWQLEHTANAPPPLPTFPSYLRKKRNCISTDWWTGPLFHEYVYVDDEQNNSQQPHTF
jgi:hypothetical protein